MNPEHGEGRPHPRAGPAEGPSATGILRCLLLGRRGKMRRLSPEGFLEVVGQHFGEEAEC